MSDKVYAVLDTDTVGVYALSDWYATLDSVTISEPGYYTITGGYTFDHSATPGDQLADMTGYATGDTVEYFHIQTSIPASLNACAMRRECSRVMANRMAVRPARCC